MIQYLKIKENQLFVESCEEEQLEDRLYQEVGSNFGHRHILNQKYVIIEDNCLEGPPSRINESLFDRGVLYGTCVVLKKGYASLEEEDLAYWRREFHSSK